MFQQCVEKGIEDWGGNTDGDTVGEMLECKTRFPSNTEMQVPGRANIFTSTTELPVSSGLKRSKLLWKLYSTLISYPACALLLMVEVFVVKMGFVHVACVYINKTFKDHPFALRPSDMTWLVCTQLNTLTVQNRDSASTETTRDGPWHTLPPEPCLDNAPKS